MRNMKENLISRITEKVAHSLGETSIKITENAMGKCMSGWVYEPKIPFEILTEKKNSCDIK